MYKFVPFKKLRKDLKKIKKSNSKEFYSDLESVIKAIGDDPLNYGVPYTGKLDGYFKVVFGEKPEYRIIYSFTNLEDIKTRPEDFLDCFIDDDFENYDGIYEVFYIRTREECTKLYKNGF